MISHRKILLDKWPLLVRLFFVLCGVVPALCAAGAAAQGDVRGAIVASLISLLLVSLYFLENRFLLEAEDKSVRICFRWTFYRSDRRVPLADIAQMYVRALGKGGREIGLQLTDRSLLPLCQPMGYQSDKQDLARQIARRLGVTVVLIPLSNAPMTNSQLFGMNLILYAFAAVWGLVAWIGATRPARDERSAWPMVWICAGLSALILTANWRTTIREILRRRKG